MKKMRMAGLFFLIVCMLTACGTKKTEEKTEYKMYYLSAAETSLEEEIYTPTQTKTKDIVEEICEKLTEMNPDNDHLRLLPKKVEILDCEYKNGTVCIDFNKEYKEMKNTREILVRAGIVKVFTQLQAVSGVTFEVEGEPLLDSNGEEVGTLGKDSFIENEGRNINTYLYTEQTLYFANKDGDKLVKQQVSRHYSSNVPLEKAIVEWLIKGPTNSDAQATISPSTKILGVSIVEGVCYVNLDKTFLNDPMNIQEKLPIYSIVNSLMDACKIHGVQISVEGETKVTFRESMNLDKLYKADYSLVEDEETIDE